MVPEKTCTWYVTEDIDLEIVHCNDDDGFCLMKDLFTKCYGKCNEYSEVKNEDD